jgi:prephenate dehydratase
MFGMKEPRELIDDDTKSNNELPPHSSKNTAYTTNTTTTTVTSSVEKQKGHPFRGSLIFSIQDELGALRRVLSVLTEMSINMTRIESRPSNTDKWDYDFFVDFLATDDSLTMEQIENNLKKMDLVKHAKLLGLTRSEMSKEQSNSIDGCLSDASHFTHVYCVCMCLYI